MSRFKLHTPLNYTVAIFAALAIFFGTPHTLALTGSDWKAGEIIDDPLFYDNQSMSVQDIQNFLNSKVPNCDTQGTQSASDLGYPNMTHAQYAAMKGWPGPPYICLKDYMQVPQSNSVVDNYSGSTPQGAISAAQIIKNAADQYNISPRAILVTLHKESLNLIFDTWPLQSQYTNAMGYGCPDTAACSPAYAGFYNQISNAAYQFNYYKANPSQFRYQPTSTVNVYWNPNSGCGSAPVSIQNSATAGLYNYTPYQPNSAALNNLYGSGDSCSAYGNRNFWRIYNDWFGSTLVSAYHWQPSQQSAYTSSSLSTPSDLNSVATNSRRTYLSVKVLNDGKATWYPGKIFLGTAGPNDRSSAVYDNTWITQNRAATITESSVAPGQYATFNFWVNTPQQAGTYQEHFNLVAEGITWMNDMGLYYQFNVQPAQFSWSVTQQEAYADSTLQTKVDLSTVPQKTRVYLYTKVQNTGNVTWYQSSTHLATSGPRDRQSALYDVTWLSQNRPASLNETSVAPGQYGTFGFWINTPNTGNLREYFNLVTEGTAWFNDIGYYYPITTVPRTYAWQNNIQTAYTDSTMSTPVDLANIQPGQRFYLYMKVQNTSNIPWYHGSLNLGTNNPRDRQSAFYDSTWIAQNRLATVTEASVAPGQYGTFGMYVTAPITRGTYKEYYNFVYDGQSWLNDIGLYYQITVK